MIRPHNGSECFYRLCHGCPKHPTLSWTSVYISEDLPAERVACMEGNLPDYIPLEGSAIVKKDDPAAWNLGLALKRRQKCLHSLLFIKHLF